MSAPRVALGLPLYGGEELLDAALSSLLAQTFADFVLVVVDDGPPGRPAEIVAEHAARDPRVRYERNAQRLGMIGNWRRTYERALAAAPGAGLFAWTSDHDLWHPRWLEALVGALDADPGAVLAYPLTERISATGETIDPPPRRFDTAGLEDPRVRARTANYRMAAGDMVYGLHRADALARAGVFRRALAPDKLLLTELALEGRFVQVPEVLWQRRFRHDVSAERQRRALFAEAPPRSARLPWWVAHTRVLARRGGVRLAGEVLVLNAQRRVRKRVLKVPAVQRALGRASALRRSRRAAIRP